jgi:hypothetical protein
VPGGILATFWMEMGRYAARQQGALHLADVVLGPRGGSGRVGHGRDPALSRRWVSAFRSSGTLPAVFSSLCNAPVCVADTHRTAHIHRRTP